MIDFLFKILHELMFLAGYVGGGNAFPKQLSNEEEKKYLDLFANGDMNARNILIERDGDTVIFVLCPEPDKAIRKIKKLI